MNEAVFGVLGVGNIGSAHAGALYRGDIPGARLGYLCDVDPKKRDFCRENYPGVEVLDDAGKLFDARPDAVIVSVPHPLHAKMGIAALEAGISVLTEKPVDISLKRARVLCEAAKKSGKTLAVMLNQRTDPLFIKARELVKTGALGDLKRSVWIVTNWYRTQEYYDSGDWRASWTGEGGGVLMNQAPHNLDLWQWICGMPSSLRAECPRGKFHDIEVEDEATLFCRYPNGASGVFVASTGDYPGTNRLEITGTKGKLVLEKSRLTLETFSPDERVFCFDKARKPRDTQKTTLFQNGKGSHAAILRNFTNHLLFGEELISPGEDGLAQVTITNAAYLSAFKGREVDIPIDEEEYEELLRDLQKNSRRSAGASSSPDGKYKTRWQVNW